MAPNWAKWLSWAFGLAFCTLWFGPIGLFVAFHMAKAANGRVAIQIAAASLGLAAALSYCEAAAVLLKCRAGQMPIPMSRERPLAWVTMALVAIGILAVAVAGWRGQL